MNRIVRISRPALNLAALSVLRSSLTAVRCAATLLVTGAATERDRGLGVAMLNAIGTAEDAVRRLNGTSPPGGLEDTRLN